MIIETHKALVIKQLPHLKTWLVRGIRACVKEIFSVWLTHPRLDKIGLVKYHPEGLGIPPETEASHFNAIIAPYADSMGISIESYMQKFNDGEVKNSNLETYFLHDRAVRESGHDTTYRFENRCANLATIDLNCLIYKYELDIYTCLNAHFGGAIRLRIRKGGLGSPYLVSFKKWFELVNNIYTLECIGDAVLDPRWNCYWAQGIIIYDIIADQWMRNDQVFEDIDFKFEDMDESSPDFVAYLPSSLFLNLSKKMQDLVNKYLWCPNRNLYFDYDCALGKMSNYETVTCVWALYSGLASLTHASLLVPNILKTFEHDGGLVSGIKYLIERN